mmetsp:Transcript_22233/g.61997  ORF Transcript_22233/g.61997 Transcript_22233/m.61997 type:complete len:333 (+) Transcript_22233:2466-3464(+)
MKRFTQCSVTLLPCAKRSEVLSSLGRDVAVDLHYDLAEHLVALRDGEEDVRIVSVLVGLQQALLLLVHVDLVEESSECGLLLLLCVGHFLLQLSECFADILVGVVDLVGVHEISLRLLVHSQVSSCQSSSVQNLDVVLLGINLQHLVAGAGGIRPFVQFDVAHRGVGPAADVQLLFTVGDVISRNSFLHGVLCGLLVLGGGLEEELLFEVLGAKSFHVVCNLQSLLRTHLPALLLLFGKSQQFHIEEELGLCGNLWWTAAVPVTVIAADLENGLLAHLHGCKTLIPSLNDHALADCELEWLSAITGAIEFGTVACQRSGVVRRHLVAIWRWA